MNGPQVPDQIPPEILAEPDEHTRWRLLEALAAQVAHEQKAMIINTFLDHGGQSGTYGAAPKAAEALGIETKKVWNTVQRHPDLVQEIQQQRAQVKRPGVTRSE